MRSVKTGFLSLVLLSAGLPCAAQSLLDSLLRDLDAKSPVQTSRTLADPTRPRDPAFAPDNAIVFAMLNPAPSGQASVGMRHVDLVPWSTTAQTNADSTPESAAFAQNLSLSSRKEDVIPSGAQRPVLPAVNIRHVEHQASLHNSSVNHADVTSNIHIETRGPIGEIDEVANTAIGALNSGDIDLRIKSSSVNVVVQQ